MLPFCANSHLGNFLNQGLGSVWGWGSSGQSCILGRCLFHHQRMAALCDWNSNFLRSCGGNLTKCSHDVRRLEWQLNFLLYFYFLKKVFIWKVNEWEKRERGSERESDLFHLLVYSPSACNSWGWARLKLGARNSIQVSHSHEWQGIQLLDSSLATSPGAH